jgi:hypothetical protein
VYLITRLFLFFLYVGFVSQEIVLKGSGDYTVTMTPGENKLDEVVVVGYGTTKGRDLTGASCLVKACGNHARPARNLWNRYREE